MLFAEKVQLSPCAAGDLVIQKFQANSSQFFIPEHRVISVDSHLCKAYLEGVGWVDWDELEVVESGGCDALTPSGNTGSAGQVTLPSSLKVSEIALGGTQYKARVDWLQGTIHYDSARIWNQLLNKLSLLLDLKLVENPTGFTRGKSYKQSGYGPGGVMVAWSHPSDERPMGEGWLSIPGRVMGSLPLFAQYSLWQLLADHKFIATRIDVALDCFNPSFTTTDVLNAARAGNFTGFRHRATQDKAGNFKPASYDFHGSPYVNRDGIQMEGYTVYFGRAGGDKRFTFYDKLAEALNNAKNSGLSLDDIYRDSNCLRIEGRFYDEQARVRFYDLLNVLVRDREGREVAQRIASMVVGGIDFRDREANKRLDRCPQLEWWEEICNCFERVTFPVPRPMASLERTIEWHFRQVAGSFAVTEQVFGFGALNEYLNKLLAAGRTKLGQAHDALIDLSSKAVCEGRLSLEAFYQQWDLSAV
jgi:hypothetical protein